MKNILKFLFSTLIVGVSGAVYHTVSQKPSFRRTASSTVSAVQSERSAQRAVRRAQLEQQAVAEEVAIPVSFAVVHETVGHKPAAKPAQVVATEQVAVHKSSAISPTTSSVSYSYTPQDTYVEPSADYAPVQNYDYPEYYPMHYEPNNSSRVPATTHQTAPVSHLQQPLDLSAYAPYQARALEQKDIEKDDVMPRFSRRNVDRSDRSHAQVAEPQTQEQQVVQKTSSAVKRNLIRGLFAAAGLATMQAFNLARWLANKFLGRTNNQDTAVQESSDQLGDGAFVPLWISNSANEASKKLIGGPSDGGTPVVPQIPAAQASQALVVATPASTAVTQLESNVVAENQGLFNYVKRLFTTPFGQVRLGLLLAQAGMYCAMVRGAYQADQRALADGACNVAMAHVRNNPLMPRCDALPAPVAMQPENKFAGLLQRAGVLVPCRPILP